VHAFEDEVQASPEEVWRALVDPDMTQRYYYGRRLESALEPGAPYRYGDAVDGRIVAIDPPRRLELTARYAFHPVAREEPPHRVLWEIDEVAPGRSRVRLSADGYGPDTETARMNARGMEPILKGLVALFNPSLTARLEEIGPIEVRAIGPELVDDFLAFFDGDAFRDNPAWADCYCAEWMRADDGDHTGDENRAFSGAAIRAGRMRGYLAYASGKPVGWLNAGPRRDIARLARIENRQVDDPERVGATVCFVIAAPYRRHGVARRLLDAALEGFAREGLAYAEAYPAREDTSDGGAFQGPLALYLAAGFESYRDIGNRLIVRKKLG